MLCKCVNSADERVAVAQVAAGRVYGSHASSGGEYRCREGRRAGAIDGRVAVALSAAGRGLRSLRQLKINTHY